jgi:hypothetical protein
MITGFLSVRGIRDHLILRSIDRSVGRIAHNQFSPSFLPRSVGRREVRKNCLSFAFFSIIAKCLLDRPLLLPQQLWGFFSSAAVNGWGSGSCCWCVWFFRRPLADMINVHNACRRSLAAAAAAATDLRFAAYSFFSFARAVSHSLVRS